MDVLPQSITLLIFSHLPYRFVRTTASLVCKAWRQIAYDRSLIKCATDEEFLEVKARDSSKEAVNTFLQVVKWRPSLFLCIDLCGAKTTWETFCEIAHCCAELKVLNVARIEGEIPEYPLIRATNIVELNLSETLIDDCLFVLITENLPKLGVVNVSRCCNLTTLAIQNASFPSLRFLGIADCMVSIDAILCAIDKHGIFAMCVKGIKLRSDEIAHLVEQYPDIAEIGIPTLCGLSQGTVSDQALPQSCFYCRSSSLLTVLSAKEAIDGSWMEL